MSVILGIRTDGDQDLWIDLHQNRVEMVDLGVNNEREESVFRERTRSRLPNEEGI